MGGASCSALYSGVGSMASGVNYSRTLEGSAAPHRRRRSVERVIPKSLRKVANWASGHNGS